MPIHNCEVALADCQSAAAVATADASWTAMRVGLDRCLKLRVHLKTMHALRRCIMAAVN
jgi:hypothetical protein